MYDDGKANGARLVEGADILKVAAKRGAGKWVRWILGSGSRRKRSDRLGHRCRDIGEGFKRFHRQRKAMPVFIHVDMMNDNISLS